jgi:hypothetical protein
MTRYWADHDRTINDPWVDEPCVGERTVCECRPVGTPVAAFAEGEIFMVRDSLMCDVLLLLEKPPVSAVGEFVRTGRDCDTASPTDPE